LPSDIDGLTAPPAGSPAYFLNFGTNSLNLWQVSNLNFTNGTGTISSPTNLPVAAFAAACGGGACIPQLGTNQRLDSLADRLMYRLAYRNFGDHEALVVNHSVTAGTGTGIRWYEIRSPGATPVVFQQGTFAPDTSFRWMGSAAMDQAGNIAVGYSVSSTTLNPAIRFTGRAPSDPLGTLGTELSIQVGTGSQLANLSRWGDYSSISVDPTDDCTFWYTTEYLKANGTFNWSTRIANFKFAGCNAAPDFALTATPASQSITAGNSTSYTATVTPSGGYTGTVTFSVLGLPAGATGTFTPTSVTTSGSSTLGITTTAAVAAGTYPLTISGTDGTLTHTASVNLVVKAPVVGDFTITASPASQTVAAGSSTSYTATITPSGGFTDAVVFSASGLPTGATATFAPTSVPGTGNSTMTVATTAATAAGTYVVTITGTGSTITHSTTVTLVVTAPADFSISATPASLTVARNSTGHYTVTIGAINGFAGTVNLSVSGLPRNTTATFSPTSVTGAGTSTLNISAGNRRGSATLTITGTSGTKTHSTTVSLTIN
jgi:hypothetical protein